MKHLLFILPLVALPLSGCHDGFKPRTGAPWKQDLLNEGPPGPPKFQQGWKDGCETAISANTNSLLKFSYTFKQDGYLAQDPVYYAGWKTAWEYCMKYTFNYLHMEYIVGDW